jgi:hypothetical protein
MGQCGPSEDIKVGDTIHMAWIDHSSLLIEKVIIDEHLVPRHDKVDIDIIGDLQVAIHAQESGEGSIDGVVESHGI